MPERVNIQDAVTAFTAFTPGRLIASGRAADVYAFGDGYVLRRYRTPNFLLYEAAVMSWVAAHGYPVPDVVAASGPDLVMTRVDGPTMLKDLEKHPWRVFTHARTIADLLKRLHAIPPPSWLVPRHGSGSEIIHLDLHPDNVMVTRDGPVVIDWTNAGLGDGDAEVADLWLITACATIPGSGARRVLLGLARGLFVRALLSQFDRDAVRKKLRIAAEHRSRDRNMGAVELERMRELVERFGT